MIDYMKMRGCKRTVQNATTALDHQLVLGSPWILIKRYKLLRCGSPLDINWEIWTTDKTFRIFQFHAVEMGLNGDPNQSLFHRRILDPSLTSIIECSGWPTAENTALCTLCQLIRLLWHKYFSQFFILTISLREKNNLSLQGTLLVACTFYPFFNEIKN